MYNGYGHNHTVAILINKSIQDACRYRYNFTYNWIDLTQFFGQRIIR